MRKFASILGLLLQVIVAGNAAAQDVERLFIVRNMEGSATLIDDQRVASIGSLLTWNGYRTDSGGGNGFRLSLTPQLYSDPNMNGGYTGTGFTLYGFQFIVDPAFRAKQGTVLGAKLSSEAFVKTGPGRTLRFSSDFSLGKTSEHTLKDANAALCSLNEIVNRLYFDTCFQKWLIDRTLGDSTSTTQSVQLSKIFLTGDGIASVALKASKDTNANTSVRSIQITARTLSKSGVLGELYLASDIENSGQFGYETIGMSLQSELFGATTSLSFETTRSTDGLFYGTLRSAEAAKVTVSRKIANDLTLEIGYQRTDASIELFSSENMTFSLSMRPILF